MTIAVVGEDDAGKSSFIKCALDMKSAPPSFSTKKKMSLDGSVYMVRLLEIDLKQVVIDQDKQIIWPRLGRDNAAPIVDGVLLLHDSTRPEKLSETSELTGTFNSSPGISRGRLPRYDTYPPHLSARYVPPVTTSSLDAEADTRVTPLQMPWMHHPCHSFWLPANAICALRTANSL